ncbi:unnamed protein product [Nesidiocoris tenuis]|uniref:Integrase catalytic domain-containing protein n=1 Tax=Nesidiocoris tenuis TaxID=355587 RepID=A0A6H5FY23_9HEMI|nr:unnamed protein product [Nesidiocoris tenuis]
MNLEKRTISELPYVLIPKSNLKILIDTGSTKSYCNPTIAENFFQNKIRKEPFIVKTAHGSSRGNFTTLVPCEKLHVAKEKVIEEKNKDREDLPAIPPEVYVKTVQKQSKTKPKYNKEIIKTIDHELKTAQIIPRHHNTKEKIHLSNIRRPKKFSESVINAWDDTLDRSEVLTKKFGLLTLRESNWLNDKIINFYMELIDQRSRQNHKLPTTFSFNTFLYVSLKAGGYTRVKNYTRKTDLFEKDIIFIPIFKAAHWRLITIYIKLQKIEYLDSLGNDGTDILEDIKNYLTEEHNHKKGTPLDTTNWKFTQRTDIPLQQNNDDCGVFVCQYAKSLGSSEEIQIKHSQIPEFFGYQFNPDDDMATHMSKLKNLWDALKKEISRSDNATCDLPELFLICKILGTLPEKYFSFKASWMLVAKNERTVENLTNQLCAHERALAKKDGFRSGDEVLAATSKPQNKYEKSEVQEKLLSFLAEVKTAGFAVKELLSDNGGEFDCQAVQEILAKNGIRHRLTMPYAHEQAGCVEREHRTVVEMARSMMHSREGRIPQGLWAELINSAVYILNITGPTKVDSKSPYELWTGKKPSLKHLRIIGSYCYVHVPKETRKKMDKKSKKGILVGYENWDGYRIWYPDDNKILRSRDIVFDEQVLISSRGIVEIKIDESTQTEIENHPDHDDSEEVAVDEEGTYREDESDQSEHIPQLRDRSLLKSPNRFQASTNFAMSFVYEMEAAKTPETYRQALQSEDREHWKKAMITMEY